jgi:cytochrome c-type biogenesis protein CcmH/NrfG
MKASIRSFLLGLLLAPAAALAADTGGPPAFSQPKDPVLEQYAAARSRQDWAGAAEAMRSGVAKDPSNADYHNLYAYSMRKGPNPNMDLVFKHYNEALRLDPRHRGAHEYLGEAYLMVGNLAKAKEHLAQLDKLCLFGCDEYSELKKAVAEFEAKQARR